MLAARVGPRGSGVLGLMLGAMLGSAVFVVLIWGQLSHIAHADEQEQAPA